MGERMKGILVILGVSTRKKKSFFLKKRVGSEGKVGSQGKVVCPFGNSREIGGVKGLEKNEKRRGFLMHELQMTTRYESANDT